MIHYTKYLSSKPKNKEWITFVHGAGGSSTIWFKQIKYFSQYYNLLLLDLRGHGKSKAIPLNPFNKKYTFNSITFDILEVLDKEKIKKSHFVGISLGTILIRNFAEKYPSRVKSLIMGGAILKLNLRSKILMFLGNSTKSILPSRTIKNTYSMMPSSAQVQIVAFSKRISSFDGGDSFP